MASAQTHAKADAGINAYTGAGANANAHTRPAANLRVWYRACFWYSLGSQPSQISERRARTARKLVPSETAKNEAMQNSIGVKRKAELIATIVFFSCQVFKFD